MMKVAGMPVTLRLVDAMDIGISRTEDGVVVVPPARIDATNAVAFEQACQKLIDEGTKDLVLDFGAVRYISSAGIRSIVSLAKQVQDTGGRFRLANLEGMVRQIFDISGLLPLFTTITINKA